jgi:UPF0755 protein
MKKLFFIFFLFLLFVIFDFYYQIFTPINNFPINKTFYVEKGETGEIILNNLEKNGFIKSAFYGKILNKFIAMNYKNGEYFFDYNASTFQVLQAINVRQNVYKITIPEGYTKFQIADKLDNLNLQKFSKQDFLENADEGYLFPDTYFFESTDDAKTILNKLENNFKKKVNNQFGRDLTFEEIILASILEREARDENDMKMVAGILKNRLAKNMPLQVDATVLYGQGAWKERLYFKDLNHESSYNTYQNTGLPIGPISNPGINALDAAVNFTKNNYLYYLTGSDGVMHYAKTFDEHVNNRKYLR